MLNSDLRAAVAEEKATALEASQIMTAGHLQVLFLRVCIQVSDIKEKQNTADVGS